MSKQQKQSLKQVLTSILIGACVAFMSTLFEGLANVFKQHSTELVAGGVSSFYHFIRTFKV